MNTRQKKYLIVIGIMLVTAALANQLNYGMFYKAQAAVQAIQKIPMQIGQWQGVDVPLEKKVYEILETQSIIHRVYILKDRRVFLSIVYYPETKVDFHAPESCLGGLGISMEKTSESIEILNNGENINLNINQLTSLNKNHPELVYYFYKAGGYVGQSYVNLRLRLAWNKIFDNDKSGSLIRLSSNLPNIEQASTDLRDFLQKLYPFIMQYL